MSVKGAIVHARARPVFAAATFCASALLIVNGGLALFAVGLVVATAMQWQYARAHPQPPMPGIGTLVRLVLLVVGTAALSTYMHGNGLNRIDNIVRLLLIPWCAWLAYASGVKRDGLWAGALVGIALAFAVACWDVAAGEARAGGGGNPIVFAHLTLLLLAVAMFAAPGTHRVRERRVIACVVVLAACVTVFSGSRGALLALASLVVVALVRGREISRRRVTCALLALALGALAVWWIPAFRAPLRLDFIGPDVQAFMHDNPDTPIGARLQLLTLAWQSFIEHPLRGIGLENFGTLVRELPGCQRVPPMGMCELEHAHNDVAEWSAALGVPGLLAILCIYAVPMAMFVAIIRAARDGAVRDAAWAGAMVVWVFMISGVSQSMFSHAITASGYAIFVGTLLGIAWHESTQHMDKDRMT